MKKPISNKTIKKDSTQDWKSKGVFPAIGSSLHSVGKRQRQDFYSSDPAAITFLDKYNLLDKDKRYWENACGNGNLSKELIRLGYDVVSSDKYDWGYGDVGVDFFQCQEKFEGNIITNPPFSKINDWIVHCLDIATDKVYILGRIQVVESVSRYELIFKENPPIYVCPFVRRMSCYKNDDRNVNPPAMCLAWFIWDNKNKNTDTKMYWLI